MKVRIWAAALAVLVAAPVTPQAAPDVEPPPALVLYGGMPGRLTIERDHLGGNPFASGLIDVLNMPHVRLADFGQRVAAATAQHSGGWQLPDVPRRMPASDWTVGAAPGETRVALVVAVADYSRAPGALSLKGSKFDAERLVAALQEAGFETRLALDLDRAALADELARFADQSRTADVALIYAGGHGVQHRRVAHLILGDYPEPRNAGFLATHAISVPELSEAARARTLNLVLFAACRNDPFLP